MATFNRLILSAGFRLAIVGLIAGVIAGLLGGTIRPARYVSEASFNVPAYRDPRQPTAKHRQRPDRS